MAFEAGDYGRDEDETLAEARERSGRAAGVGSGGNGGGGMGMGSVDGPAEALAAVYGTYSSGGRTSIIGNQAAIARGYTQLQQGKTNRTGGITDTSPIGYSSM